MLFLADCMRKVYIIWTKLDVLSSFPSPSPPYYFTFLNIEHTNQYSIKRRINLGEACMYLHVVAYFLVCGFVVPSPL